MESTHTLKIMNAEGADLLHNPIKAMGLTVNSTLADIRRFLEKEHDLSDFNFLDSDACLITKSYEASTMTKDLAVIKIAASKKKENKYDKADKPLIESVRDVKKMEHTLDKDEYEKANKKELSSLSLKDNIEGEGKYCSIKDLNKDQFMEILEGVNYRFGFRLTKNGVMISLSLPFNKKQIPSDFQSYVVKHEKTVRDVKQETSLSKISMMKFGCLSVDSSLSYPYAGIYGYYSEETNQTEEKNQSAKYNFKYYDVRKGEINLNNYRELSQEFLTFFNGKEITIDILNKFVETYGAYVVESVIIGGRLYTVEKVSASSSINEKETGSNKGIDGKSPMTSGTVGDGVDKENRKKKGEGNTRTNQEFRIENKGGDSLKVDDESEWRNSLSNYKTWDSIEITKMSRTIDLLPKNIFDAINKKFFTVAKINLKLEDFLPEECKESDWVNIRCIEGLFLCMRSDSSLRQDYCGINENYLWKFIKHSDGSFSIQSKFKSLVIQSQGKEKGLAIEVGAYDASDKQKWYLQKYMDTNYFFIINKFSQLTIDCYQNSQVGWQYVSGDPTDGASHHAYKCERVFDILLNTNSLVSVDNLDWCRIRSKSSGMYLRGGSDLTQANYQNIDEFKFHYFGGIIHCKKNLYAIDNLNNGSKNRNKVGMYKPNRDLNQIWAVHASGNSEYFRLENKGVGKSLDNKGSKIEGTGMHIFDSDSNNLNQLFKFEKII